MGFVRKEIIIGILVSIFATFCGLFIYVQYVSRYGFYETLALIKEGGMLGPVLTLAALPNLFVFFIFLKKKQDFRARGVLATTVGIALLVLVLKLL